MDLTGWRVSSQETSEKAPACSTDPLHAEEDGADKKKNHTSPEKRKVEQLRNQSAADYSSLSKQAFMLAKAEHYKLICARIILSRLECV